MKNKRGDPNNSGRMASIRAMLRAHWPLLEDSNPLWDWPLRIRTSYNGVHCMGYASSNPTPRTKYSYRMGGCFVVESAALRTKVGVYGRPTIVYEGALMRYHSTL